MTSLAEMKMNEKLDLEEAGGEEGRVASPVRKIGVPKTRMLALLRAPGVYVPLSALTSRCAALAVWPSWKRCRRHEGVRSGSLTSPRASSSMTMSSACSKILSSAMRCGANTS